MIKKILNAIKNFKFKFSVLSIFVVLSIFLICVGIYNSIFNKPQTQTVDLNTVLSYPVSYVPTSYAEFWQGKVTLEPLNKDQMQIQYSTSNCSSVTAGMPVYYNDDYSKLMVITNKNLLANENDADQYAEAEKVIFGLEGLPLNADLKAFKANCSDFNLMKFANLNLAYPDTDNSIAFAGFGKSSSIPSTIDGLGVYIYVYARRGDNLIEISRVLKGSEVFTQSDYSNCSQNISTFYSCLSDKYNLDTSIQGKIQQEGMYLTQFFKLPQ